MPLPARASAPLPRQAVIARLFEEHGGRMLAIARRLCRDREDAEDLVQDTFLQAFRKWHQFDGRASAAGWLYRIAARLCLKVRSRRSRNRTRSLDAALPFVSASMPDVPVQHDLLAAHVRRELLERVEQAIAHLPVLFRMPFVLKEVAGLSLEQVGQALDVKVATVKTRVHRARLHVRREVERALPKRAGIPPAYAKQVCLDLLRAKQDALDRGVCLPELERVTCERCQAVFATLDLSHDACREIARGKLPVRLARRVLNQMNGTSPRKAARTRARR